MRTTSKTRAVVLRNVGGPLSFETLNIPALKPGQVLVKILYAGLCQSQINEIKGRKGSEFIPHLLGHEASGVVVEVGVGVKKVCEYDFVVVSWIKGEGMDVPAAQYTTDWGGVVNAGAAAVFSDYAVVSENRVVRVPSEIEPKVAALLGCAIPTGMGIVETLGVKPGDSVAIFGIGGIGAAALMRAKSIGADCYAIDVVPWKLDWARRVLDIQKVFLASDISVSGFDFAIECSGNKAAMQQALALIHRQGTMVVAGNLPAGETIAVDPFELIQGKKLRGTWGGNVPIDDAIARYAQAYLSGELKLDALISQTYTFSDLEQGLDDLIKGNLIRGIVRMEHFPISAD